MHILLIALSIIAPGCHSAQVRGLDYQVCGARTTVAVPGRDDLTYALPANVWVWSMYTNEGDDSRLGA